MQDTQKFILVLGTAGIVFLMTREPSKIDDPMEVQMADLKMGGDDPPKFKPFQPTPKQQVQGNLEQVVLQMQGICNTIKVSFRPRQQQVFSQILEGGHAVQRSDVSRELQSLLQ